MKTATYRTLDGKTIEVEYDPEAPCVICGKPVIEASVGGTAVCPWCDSGEKRPPLWHDGGVGFPVIFRCDECDYEADVIETDG